tara:strand:+ start:3550 stop:4179 length:630 start_codon:yes stop_codon:yes gene_type:complete
MNAMNKILISPHIDDEVLGCGGILNSDFMVVYGGADESSVDVIHNRPTASERMEELASVTAITGHHSEILPNKVNLYKERDLLKDMERVINTYKPLEIYLPHPSYNKDHRELYNAALTALRPHDKNHFVKRVLVYEQPHVFFWNHGCPEFTPTYFIPIDIEKKIELYNLMKSQVRSFRSNEHIKSLAKLRGGQSNTAYAEAFEVLRWVE